MKNFFAELKRRHVYKVAVAYAIVGWLVMQVAATVVPALHLSDKITSAVVVLVILGFPIALILAWAFELTPEGIKRTDEIEATKPKGRAWIYVAIIAAVLSLGLFFLGRLTVSSKQSGSAEALSKSIAVLPFESLSEDKNNAYFADGIQDEILARLSKIADLKVISRTSTQKYKSAPDDLREIAQKLGVANVLEGSVQKSNDQVRVTVQLINALNDSHLWAETYDRKLSDIFGVESEIAQKIAGSLAAKLTGREKEQVAAVGTTNPQAYDALLHALALRNFQTIVEADQLIEFCHRAIELDPNYADAWATLAYWLAWKFDGVFRTPDLEPQVRAAAENALRLAPDSAKAHQAMGSYYSSCRRDYSAALSEVEKARELAPNDGSILTDLGFMQRATGKIEESLKTMKKAADLDPLNPNPWGLIASTYQGLRQFDEARSMWDRTLAVAPDNINILAAKASTYQDQGNLDAAWKILSLHPFPIFPIGAIPVYREQYYLWRDYGALVEFIKTVNLTGKDSPRILIAFGDALLANLYLLNDERNLALLHAHKAQGEVRDTPVRIVSGGFVLSGFYIECMARLGNRDEVEREIQRLFTEAKDDQWALPVCENWAARGYALLGDLDKAIPLLEDSLAKPNGTTTAYLRLDPAFDGVRSDPRFQKLTSNKP
jgi:TolB-like protein